MTMPSEIQELIDAYLDGDITPPAIDRLRAWLEESDQHVVDFARQVYQHQQLREVLVADNVVKCLAEDGPEQTRPHQTLPADPVNMLGMTFLSDSVGDANCGFAPGPEKNHLFGMISIVPYFMIFIIAAAVGSFVTYLVVRPEDQRSMPLAAEVGIPSGKQNHYATTLVNVTNCRWDETRSTANTRGGSPLQPGETLCLLEGIAEINSALPYGVIGRFQIEGPACLKLAGDGMPNLEYGVLVAQFTCDFGLFSLGVPSGRIEVRGGGSIGVVAASNEVELHVLDGEATFRPGWSMAPSAQNNVSVAVGDLLRISTSQDTGVDIHRGQANQDRFASLTSMAASRLDIPEAYVRAVRQAQPLAYWRFEDSSDPAMVRNVMGDQYHFRVCADGIRHRLYRENKAAESGANLDPYYLMTDDTFDGVIDESYTIEAWIKPSHFHHASLFSFIRGPFGPSGSTEHAMVIELCGRSGDFSFDGVEKPGQVRFLHRNPPGDKFGTSCFSNVSYRPRKWQHVVASKNHEDMRLYLDGKLVGEAKDATDFPSGLRFLMARLRPPNSYRQYFGEFDEVAVYSRALSPEEIKHHYELVLPPAGNEPAARLPKDL